MYRTFLLGNILAALLLSLFTLPATAATVPCDKSRTVAPVKLLKDGTYGKTWERSYGTTQMSSGWRNRRNLTVKVGLIRLNQPIRAFWIREIYHVCSASRLKEVGRAHFFYVAQGSGVVPSGVKPLRIDHWSTKGLYGMARSGMWVTSRITIEMPNGKRTSIRATIPILPKDVANPNS